MAPDNTELTKALFNQGVIPHGLVGPEAMELVKELAVTEDKLKEEGYKKKIDELNGNVKDLQKQLKTSHENQKELKLLLDVFKGSVKESRSKVYFLVTGTQYTSVLIMRVRGELKYFPISVIFSPSYIRL